MRWLLAETERATSHCQTGNLRDRLNKVARQRETTSAHGPEREGDKARARARLLGMQTHTS